MEVEADGNSLQRESTVEASGNCTRCVGVEHTEVAGLADTRGEDSRFFHRHLLEESIHHSVAHCSVHHPLGGSRRNPLRSPDLDLYIHHLSRLDGFHRDRELENRDRPDFHDRRSQSADYTQAARKMDSLAT